jgi:hypothetical protein
MITAEMKPLKVDVSKLVTVSRYATMRNVTRKTVYLWIEEKKIKSMTVDGVMFVILE